jgi:uncharacterized protein
VGGVFRGRRGIRAAGPLLEVLNGVAVVDHHAHGVYLDRPTLDEFRGRFSESLDPRQWPHVASGVTYRRALGELAAFFGCDPVEAAVYEHRLAAEPQEYAAALLRATNTELLLVDDGYPPPGEGTTWGQLSELAGCEARPVMRIERVAEDGVESVREQVAAARDEGFAGLKTIAAYRTGLERERIEPSVLAALEANEGTAAPLPVQVHCGFGDSDLSLPSADPAHLKPLLERYSETPFVLLHCYPFVREAGWLAHVYYNVWFDLSLTIPHVSRPLEMLREALELAPVSKLLYASDAARTPELYYLAARWWRETLAELLPELYGDHAEWAARRVLRENALELYG